MVAELSQEYPIAKALLSAKIRDIPDGFYVIFEVDGYEITVDFDRDGQPQVLVRLAREGLGRNSELDIRDPDPELALADIFNYAKEVIQALVRKR